MRGWNLLRRRKKGRGTIRFTAHEEAGQSMVEMTVGMVLLLGIIIILFEMAMLFYTYIALLNASREGAVYASLNPTMTSSQLEIYRDITEAEVLAAGLLTGSEFLTIADPQTPEGTDPLDPIIVVVTYNLNNPTQGLILPLVGRMGLAETFTMQARTEMPIR